MSEWTVGKFVAACIAILFYITGKFIGYGYLVIALVVVWVIFALIAISTKKENDGKVKDFFKLLFSPIILMIVSPLKDPSFECPRCDGSDYYHSQEQISQGAVGGIIDNPGGPDFGFMRPVSYTTYVKRCKNCNSIMNEYISRDFYNYRERWYNVTYFVFCLVLLFITFDIFLPWADENL